jgi:hypothetical protein
MNTACRHGIHMRVLEGSGLMQDGLVCVDCGRDKYPEAFGHAVRIRQWPGMIDRSLEGRKRAWQEATHERYYDRLS